MKIVKVTQWPLNGVTYVGKYDTGEIESYKVEEENKILIQGKEYIPLYSYLDERRKEFPSIRLYKNGKIKSIALEKCKEIVTKYGTYSIEKVIFYESGNIKRIFPLDGKISAYWSEEDEYKLAKEYCFKFSKEKFKAKCISLYFYESGNIKSITLWPKEIIKIFVNNIIINIRSGVSFYENGAISSCEPAFPIKINTSIGLIEAFDKNAIGICGDVNSLKFYENGKIKSLITSTNIIEVYKENKLVKTHSPKKEFIYSGSKEIDLIPVIIEFNNNEVIINRKNIYNSENFKFKIKKYEQKNLTLLGDI